MKIIASAYRLIGFLVLILSFGAFIVMPRSIFTVEYRLSPDSELYIQGSSNVNNFTCHCKEQFEKQVLTAESIGQGKELKFKDTKLALPAYSLDCGKKRMNKDMYSTLKAEQHPNIYIELKRAHRNGLKMNDLEADWTNLHADAIITIAGVEQEAELLVGTKMINEGKALRLVCHKDLTLSQFGLKTPKALLGLIKVHDCININFDLTVQLDNPL